MSGSRNGLTRSGGYSWEVGRIASCASCAAFFESLSQGHRLLRREVELSRGFLLQLGGDERRGRVSPPLPPVNLGNGEHRVLELIHQGLGGGAVRHFGLLAV